jgi:hypothetical protein
MKLSNGRHYIRLRVSIHSTAVSNCFSIVVLWVDHDDHMPIYWLARRIFISVTDKEKIQHAQACTADQPT